MCGIVGYIGPRRSTDVLLDGLSKLEYRGYDSAGIALAGPEGEIQVVKAEGRLSVLAEKVRSMPEIESHCGIGHTRWATHGAPSDINSHPHSSARISLVHNGIIENYASLKEHLIAHGYEFCSDTDTEVLVKLLDYNYHGEPLDAIMKTLGEVRGSYGLAILFRDFPDRIFSVRKESPLIVGYGKGENFLASDIPALLKYTRDYSILDEGEIAVVTKDKIQVYNELGRPVVKEHLTASWDIEAAEKGGYPHFMLKEIHEQPAALRATIGPHVENGLPQLGVDALDDEALRRIQNIHIVACGTAMHAGMVGKTAIERFAHIPVDVDIASEFRYRDPILTKDDLVIIISQSGETLDTLAALKLAQERGAKTLAVVNVVGSSIARAADWVIYTHAGPEIAVASTKAYSVQLAVMYLFALRMALARKTQSEKEIRRLTAALQQVPEQLVPLLSNCNEIKYLASQFMNSDDLFFMGRGFDYALSLEGSLKLKEISYVHSEAYAAGELKHGAISLIVNGTPVVALATQNNVYEKTISNVKEVKTRGGRVILLCKESAQVPDDVADFVIRLPEFEDIFMPMLMIVPLQLFAYYMSVLRGCDVDKPRNLAKSVTVE
ncbi:glutamine--fructose-6-phosphate transaminase (isomerizing) [uncultured Ruthenibacterium sp.]|uniref:glutamine--fructose-6-phosphate transaminase (isomerizing) n=1 Tax=uncultured Ruthenibacterium sp. TaxID=1905347 RepID=UPI00349E89DC